MKTCTCRIKEGVIGPVGGELNLREVLGKEDLLSLCGLVLRTSLWVPRGSSEEEKQKVRTPVEPKRLRIKGDEKRGLDAQSGYVKENNQAARRTIVRALRDYIQKEQLEGWHACHVYEGSPRDPQLYTVPANLILVPGALHSITHHPKIRHVLQLVVWARYGWPTGTSPTPKDVPEELRELFDELVETVCGLPLKSQLRNSGQ